VVLVFTAKEYNQRQNIAADPDADDNDIHVNPYEIRHQCKRGNHTKVAIRIIQVRNVRIEDTVGRLSRVRIITKRISY
jgi:hypothetical protein